MRRQCTLFFLLFLFSLMVFQSKKVLAGSISSAEAQVLSAVYEVYTYNGESYKALPEYTEQVRQYLQQDDVDLSEQQCAELLGMIDANLPTAIENGIFVKVDKNDSEKKEETVDKKGQGSSIDYITSPESSGKKPKKNRNKGNKRKDVDNQTTSQEEKKDSKKETSGKEDSDNTGEKPLDIEKEGGKKEENTGKEDSSGNKDTSIKENTEKKENSSENIDGTEDITVASQDKEKEIETKKASKDVLSKEDNENPLGVWSQLDEERKKEETHTVTWLIISVCSLIILFYIGKMIYRYYVLYLSHPRASSQWKPEHLSDMHCHLLPGVDDGSMNMEMTKKLLRMEIENGVDTILFTPHFRRGKSRFNNERLFQVFEEVKQEALKMKPDMKLYLGEELYYDHSLCHALEEGNALKLNGTDYVLIEFSPEVEYKTIHKACQSLVMLGVAPVLAHIERYPALIAKTDRLEEIHDMGVYYQMNITSLMGSNVSTRIYKQRKLMADGWIDIIGSDSHDDKSRNPKFKKAWKELLRLCDDEMIERIMWDNPAKMLAGEDID